MRRVLGYGSGSSRGKQLAATLMKNN